jgi:hypothetical protein
MYNVKEEAHKARALLGTDVLPADNEFLAVGLSVGRGPAVVTNHPNLLQHLRMMFLVERGRTGVLGLVLPDDQVIPIENDSGDTLEISIEDLSGEIRDDLWCILEACFADIYARQSDKREFACSYRAMLMKRLGIVDLEDDSPVQGHC